MKSMRKRQSVIQRSLKRLKKLENRYPILKFYRRTIFKETKKQIKSTLNLAKSKTPKQFIKINSAAHGAFLKIRSFRTQVRSRGSSGPL
jgi:hypothetical protein